MLVKVASYAVVLPMSRTLCNGSVVSGQRSMQGANTMASAFADMRFVSSWNEILKQTDISHETYSKLTMVKLM